METVHLDTHVVVWLHAGRLEKFSASCQSLLNGSRLVISSIVLLELEYLFEIGRLTVPSAVIFDDLQKDIDLSQAVESYGSIIQQSLQEKWTRDPFDRLIVAHARMRQLRLISKDAMIQANYPETYWE